MDEAYFAAVAALLLAVAVMLPRYVQRLPFAPSCPSCGAMTHAAHSGHCVLRLLPSLLATVVRECRRCGWHGRMRWRVAPSAAARQP